MVEIDLYSLDGSYWNIMIFSSLQKY
jgi:hypothetical protein